MNMFAEQPTIPSMLNDSELPRNLIKRNYLTECLDGKPCMVKATRVDGTLPLFDLDILHYIHNIRISYTVNAVLLRQHITILKIHWNCLRRSDQCIFSNGSTIPSSTHHPDDSRWYFHQAHFTVFIKFQCSAVLFAEHSSVTQSMIINVYI